ncbi:MAG: aminopeptidase P family protein [Bacteroidales bacterium]|nr:aminopeptidase P family protein [Bacteroidales bacterium]
MKLPHHPHRIERLKALQKALKTDAFLFTSPSAVKWLSGYFYNFETGTSPFQLLPAALFIIPDQFMCLVIADNESLSQQEHGLSLTIKPYQSYVHEKPLDYSNQFINKLNEVLKESGMTGAQIGIEHDTLPFVVSQFLQSKYPAISLIDVSDEITNLKAIKDDDEIECIRQAARLCDIGQTALHKYGKQGISELELFNLIRLDIESSAGTRVPLMADLISGARTSTGGGLPGNRKIMEGDVLLSDLTPCLNGYWGDSCNTMIIGEPAAEHRKTFALVKEALEIAINAIRPGIRAMDIDKLMRSHIGNFPHHGGHGVGTKYHEEPRITPYNDLEIAEGMVIALEPAIYTNDYGIRLEHMVVVTKSGCELLTEFQHCIQNNS